jgi:signal transduction histidine kinase
MPGLGDVAGQPFSELISIASGAQTRTFGEGSGLGLAIARALARRHGGEVTVSSRIGLGSEFVASFPARLSRINAS